MIAKLNGYFSHKPAQMSAPCALEPDYKVRLNEKLTVKKVNQILDAIDADGGYCPCQRQSPDTICHCKDFLENKKIGEPCICKIYVKQKKTDGKAKKSVSSRQKKSGIAKRKK